MGAEDNRVAHGREVVPSGRFMLLANQKKREGKTNILEEIV